jgi:hypothetical protein
MSIQIVCAWCGKHMGEKEGDAPYPISHSICPDCERKVRAETENVIKPNIPKIQQSERSVQS